MNTIAPNYIFVIILSCSFFLPHAQAACDINFNASHPITVDAGVTGEIMSSAGRPTFQFKYTNTLTLAGEPVPVVAMETLINNVELAYKKRLVIGGGGGMETIIWTTNLTGTGHDAISTWVTTAASSWRMLELNSISYKFNNGRRVNANAWWCRPDISAGREQTGQMSVAGQGTPEFTQGWESRVPPQIWKIKTSPVVTWMENVSVDISIQTPVLDFGVAYAGIPTRRELKYTVTSNVISGVVDVTYRTANIIGDARVKVLGTTQSNTEQIITSVTKNDATQITRFVEITAPEGVTGEYNGTLTIEINMP